MKKGRIIKLIGGLYTVIDESGQKSILKPLGIFRYKHLSLKVGDFVLFDQDSIYELLPRINEMDRPTIANIDQALVITSCKHPDFSSILLDKFLSLIEFNHIQPIIIITKVDLLTKEERTALEEILSYYQKYYPVIYFSTKTGEGKQAILEVVDQKVNVLTGQTGAGKSSLFNSIDPTLNLATDEISEALGRGKHTTRHVELIPFSGGWIADTPGFSKLEFLGLEDYQLKDCYPDFFEVSSNCRFKGCMHVNEPGCLVKNLVETGQIPQSRYSNYLKLIDEIQAIKKKY